MTESEHLARTLSQATRSSVAVPKPVWNVVFPAREIFPDAAFRRRTWPLYGLFDDGVRPQRSQITRGSIVVPAGRRYSAASYYNAFPAAYWAKWTEVRRVTLRLTVSADCTVSLMRSDESARVTTLARRGASAGLVEQTAQIGGMARGGWLWFTVAADGPADVVVSDAAWCVASPPARSLRASIAITTMNKPDWCIRQLKLLGRHTDLRAIDKIYLVDQGTKHVSDAEGFEEVAALLGSRLKVIRQGNLGGSGGFSRGMDEACRAGSGSVLLLDDDTVLEPESVTRALNFANRCTTPTIVGGNMFFLSEPTRLCSLAEVYNEHGVFWQPAEGTRQFCNITARPFTRQPWLHRRADADYNAWWMCLIPTAVIRRIGLAFPFFIKNDDVEYGVRAKQAGFPTVTVPGTCLWHQSWFDKDDILDWQAYFHVRNKLIMGLLYSRRPWGGALFGKMARASMSATIKMRYSAVTLHRMAVRDVLQGPWHIGGIIGTRVGEVRHARQMWPDAVSRPLAELPHRLRTWRPEELTSAADARAAYRHQLSAPRGDAARIIDGYVEPRKVWWHVEDDGDSADVAADDVQELALAAGDPEHHWKVMGRMDSAVLVNRERGTGSLLLRKPLTGACELTRVLVLYARLALQWREYQSWYRQVFSMLVSPAWWRIRFRAGR